MKPRRGVSSEPRDVSRNTKRRNVGRFKSGPEEWTKVTNHLRKTPRPCDFSNRDLHGVNFSRIAFPTHARFDGCSFKDANFKGTVFEQGASFLDCTLNGFTKINSHKGSSDLSFDRAIFCGPLSIRGLGETRSISFVGAHLQEGLSARGSNKYHPLGWPTLMFQQAQVRGDLDLENCSFSYCDFRFSHLAVALEGMENNECRARFRNSTFGTGVNFTEAEFYNVANFENTEFLGSTSFERTIFHRAPNFHDAKLHQGTRFSPKTDFPALFRDLKHPGAAESYRTLKLAMNKQHALNEELGFFLLEMRATALRLPKWRQIPYHLYDLLSVYGQSVIRPLSWYLLFHLVFAIVYSCLSGQRWEVLDSRLTALTLYGAVPFAAALRWSEVSGGGSPCPEDRLALVQMAVVAQSIVSALLLFLIALGLRNMFKVR